MKIKKRPIIACVPKPKVGLTTAEHVRVAHDIWTGGVDLLKDDENLTDQGFNRFEKRMKLSFKMRDKAERETGDKKSYLINVTAETKEMLRRAKMVADEGGEYVMIDILTVGWAGLQTLRNECQDLGLAIHAHRAFHASFTRNLDHGVSMAVVADSARLAGVDQIHIGTVVGKLVGSLKEVTDLEREISSEGVTEDRIIKKESHLLEQDWDRIKPVFPVSSGGLHPGILPDVMKILGSNIVLQVGGGIHGHPDGSHAGAKAVRQAIDLLLDKKKLSETEDPELKTALKFWGRMKPK
jgi:ribulose-bisphosphate carboxylase large chain